MFYRKTYILIQVELPRDSSRRPVEQERQVYLAEKHLSRAKDARNLDPLYTYSKDPQ
ncbi:hypothetical protein NZD89_11670 [Alicyclobacillus fastidiosus]|uniref:Uncharacterized protein n=1 Tax=Alicyclobacillus fastidiosus TaxID=392011 RepID=A0ABY6ZMB8_9BACL|nr:hypothetical protein [Alicyclobacillus fastidiosus]WAH43977.1 hypothetical protein NZD89_11670 [Alicyclobacillus fastidiosus]